MQYINGRNTKEHIYRTAKRLFHQNGYKKTTYSMIAAAAGVPAGLVNYYYKKQELISQIYMDYFTKIDHFIGEQKQQPENGLQHLILFSHIMLAQIFSDPGARAFHLEINHDHLIPQAVHEFIRSRQIAVLESFRLETTPEYLYWCATAEYGARRELIEQNRDIITDSPEFLSLTGLLSTITLRLAGLAPGIIEQNLRRADALFAQMDCSHIHMF